MSGAILGFQVILPEGPRALGIIGVGLLSRNGFWARTVIGWKLPQSIALDSHYYVNLLT